MTIRNLFQMLDAAKEKDFEITIKVSLKGLEMVSEQDRTYQ